MAVNGADLDVVLIDRIIDGDDAAFAELVGLHGAAVLARCQALLRDSAPVEDAAQNTWIRAYIHLDDFRRDSRFRTWLFAIAARECYSIARRGNRFEEITEQFAAEEADASAVIDLQAAFALLKPTDRIVLWLAHVDGYRHGEIAELLGVSEASVKMRASRARSKVRAHVS